MVKSIELILDLVTEVIYMSNGTKIIISIILAMILFVIGVLTLGVRFISNEQVQQQVRDVKIERNRKIARNKKLRSETPKLSKLEGYYIGNNETTGNNSRIIFTAKGIYLSSNDNKKVSLFKIRNAKAGYKYKRNLASGLVLNGIYSDKLETAYPKLKNRVSSLLISEKRHKLFINQKGNQATSLTNGNSVSSYSPDNVS